MLAVFKINDVDFTGLVEKDGIKVSPVQRLAKSIVTMDGTLHKTYVEKTALSVSFVTMRDSRLGDMRQAITQPAQITYLDERLGIVTKSFWVDGPASTQSRVECGTTYVSGVSLSLEEV